MSEGPPSVDDRVQSSPTDDVRGREPRSAATDAPQLELAVVTYDDRPDRGTIHPPGLVGLARMDTWLSADVDLFVDAREVR